MKNPQLSFTRRLWHLRSTAILPCAICALSSYSIAQTVSIPEEEDHIIVLTPFEVNTSQDVGYMANSTLGGSRTNTEIKDIANPLDIFTAELMEDLAVQDIQDLTSLANGVEPNGAGGYNSNGQEVSVWNYNYMQIRGFKTGTATRNFMDLNTTFEAYNSERVEFSKGPNAILFGAGNPGGSVNYSTKTPILAGNAYEIEHRADDLGSHRVSTDLNQVLIEDTLAVRLTALWEDREFYRGPSYERENAWHLTGTWRPTTNTTITVGHEERDTERASPRGVFSTDRVTGWLKAGAPIITAVPSNGQVVVGGSSGSQSAEQLGLETVNSDLWILDSDGVLRNVRRTARGDVLDVNGGNEFDTVAAGLDYPLDRWSGGPNGISDTDWSITEINLTQTISENFFLDFAYGNANSLNRTGQSVSKDIYVDPNNFGDNTHAGELYIESRPFRIDRGVSIEHMRASASYELDLTSHHKWLGTHQIAAMFERSERDEWWDNGRLTLTETPDGPSTGNLRRGALAFWLRDYINPAAGDYAMDDYRDIYYSDGISQNGYKAEFIRRESWAALHTLTEQDTLLGVLQSRWFDERLITTLGWREDQRVFYQAPYKTNDNNLPEPVAVVDNAPAGTTDSKYAAFVDDPENVGGISRNYGAVFHATDWLSLTYNHASNFSPGTESRDLYGDFVTASSGESDDFGIRLNLLDSRLNISLIKFETSELDSITRGPAVDSPIPTMKLAEQILLDNGIISISPLANDGGHTTSDRTAEGEELVVIGNPTPNWTFKLSASRTINEQRNIAPDIRAFYAERIPFYQAQDQSLQADDSGTTLGERIAEAAEDFALMETRENVRVFPASEYAARATAKYKFDGDTLFKGLSIGGTTKWTSAPVIGYYKTAAGSFDVNRSYNGNDRFEADLFFSYQRRLPRDVRWKIQLNISNVFDNDDPLAVAAINDVDAPGFAWVPYMYRPQNGRVFTLTNSFSF